MAGNTRSKIPTVIIIGAGFGGLNAVQSLSGKGFAITLVDRRNYHLFQPLLYQVATGALKAEAVAAPVRQLLRRRRDVRFVFGQVDAIDPAARTVAVGGQRLAYDYLVVACGGVTNFFGLAGIRESAHDLKGLGEADALRSHVLRTVELAARSPDGPERERLLSFAVVGGGATGVEFAGALAELLCRILPKDFPGVDLAQRTRVSIIQAGGALLPSFPPEFQEYARRRLESLGVSVHLNGRVRDYVDGRVLLQDGSEVPAHTVVWAAGICAEPLTGSLPGEKRAGGRIAVAADLSLPGWEEIFVVGDVAYGAQDGLPWPQTAPFALQSGRYVAKAICARRDHRSVAPFRFHDLGQMAVLSRFDAVAELRRPRWNGHGVLAWIGWLFLHLLYLVGFRNRLLALFDWGFDYVWNEASVRLIFDRDRARGMPSASRGPT
ncbi:MAG: NAD(P)/FAD-dependent oxidoreductase [Acidiferrobacteraceae bacterium]